MKYKKRKHQNFQDLLAVDNYNCDVRIEKVSANPMVKVTYKDTQIHSNLIGLYNANNINAAIAIGVFFEIKINSIKQSIEGYTPSNNRSQLMNKNGNSIILDAYNANPSSMDAAINNFSYLDAEAKIAILGDMFELGEESLQEHKQLIEKIADKGIETYFIGKDFYSNRIDKQHLYFYETFESFKKDFQDVKPVNKTILIKGSRGMALERSLELI
jgi:UDP-N-acetylmuramoyl-tripeptide--D-alanyl-D-alanine ligase